MPARLIPSHGILACCVLLVSRRHVHATHAVVLAAHCVSVCPAVGVISWQRTCVAERHLLLGIAALVIPLVLSLLLLLPLLLLLLRLLPLTLKSTEWISRVLILLHVALAAGALIRAVLHIRSLLEGHTAVAASAAAASPAAAPSSTLRLVLPLLILLGHPILLGGRWYLPLLHLISLVNWHPPSHVNGRLVPHLLGLKLDGRDLLLGYLQRVRLVVSQRVRHLELQCVNCRL